MQLRALKQTTTFAMLVVLNFAASSCISFDDEPKELDIKMQKSQAQIEKEKKIAIRQAKIAERKNINWQQFFRAPPSEQEKEMIRQRLSKAKEGDSYEVLMNKGNNQYAIGLLKDAEISFRKATRADESKLDPILEIARIHLRRNELEGCFEYLSHLKDRIDAEEEADPNFVFRYRYLLALAKIRVGDADKGRKILRDLISLQPTFGPGYTSLAMSYIKEGNDRAAEFIVRRGMDRSKENSNYYNILGAIAHRRQRTTLASRHFNKALELNPDNVLALVNRSTIAIENFEYERAELDLKKALAVQPDQVEALVTLAILQKKTGRKNAARGTLEKALESDPGNGLARYHMAELQLNEFDDASYALQLYYEVLQTRTASESIREQSLARIELIKQNRL